FLDIFLWCHEAFFPTEINTFNRLLDLFHALSGFCMFHLILNSLLYSPTIVFRDMQIAKGLDNLLINLLHRYVALPTFPIATIPAHTAIGCIVIALAIGCTHLAIFLILEIGWLTS